MTPRPLPLLQDLGLELDLAELHGLIVNELAADRPIRESMDRLITACAAKRPHDDWEQLRALPLGNTDDLCAWIEKPFRLDPPSEKLAGLWFGIFNPIYNRKTVADVYVCGSNRFDQDPDDCDWAVGPDWWPEYRYANSAVLAGIYEISNRKDGLHNDAEYPLCLGYGALAVREILNRISPAIVLDAAGSVGVAVGFDSGDFVLLGQFTDQGLMPFDANREPPDDQRIEEVIEDLQSRDAKIAFRAVLRVNRFGTRARAAVPALMRIATSHEDTSLRQFSLHALATVAPDDPIAKSTILRALHDSQPFVRREALQAMISMRGLSADDLAQIKNLETDSDESVACWSEIALRNIRLRHERGE